MFVWNRRTSGRIRGLGVDRAHPLWCFTGLGCHNSGLLGCPDVAMIFRNAPCHTPALCSGMFMHEGSCPPDQTNNREGQSTKRRAALLGSWAARKKQHMTAMQDQLHQLHHHPPATRLPPPLALTALQVPSLTVPTDRCRSTSARLRLRFPARARVLTCFRVLPCH